MMFTHLFRYWFAAAVFASSAGCMPAMGADIRLGPRADEITLEGPIERGDYDRLRTLLTEGTSGSMLFLASPGGDLGEAIKIGRLIRRLKLATQIPTRGLTSDINDAVIRQQAVKDPKNYICASACFFVFVAGIHRSQAFGGISILGIHRPYLPKDDLIGLSGDQAMSAANATKRIVETYLKEMSVPAKYVDEMFSIGGDQIKWISDANFEADFDGFIPELRDWINAQCDNRTKEEKIIWSKLANKAGTLTPAERVMSDALLRKYSEQLECEDRVRETLALNAYRDELRAANPQPFGALPRR